MKKFPPVHALILIAVVVAAILILALVEPTDVTVTRTAVINAPKDGSISADRAIWQKLAKLDAPLVPNGPWSEK